MNHEKKFTPYEKAKIHGERIVSDAELIKGGARYMPGEKEPRFIVTDEQRERLHQEMEQVLGEHLLTNSMLRKGSIGITVEKILEKTSATGQIGYEFEVEKEIRYVIEPLSAEEFKWKTHIVDTYDKSGRTRIRVKDGKPRLSLKVPLFSKDTEACKTCLRLEFKPNTKEQEDDLLRIRDLILEEQGTQKNEKWGTQLTMKNGKRVWLNRDITNNWWIEVDEGIEFVSPEGVRVREIKKSAVKTD